MFAVGFDACYEKQVGDYLISCTRKDMQPETTEFVAQVYYHAVGFRFNVSYAELLCQMIEEDRRLQGYSAVVYTVYDSGRRILGTGRLVISRDNLELPIQREFGIDLEKVISDRGPVGDVIEIGRLAVRGNSIRIIKLLFLAAIAGFEENDLLLAAIDLQVLRRLNRLGFRLEEIGGPRHYRGSFTCPVAQSARELKRKIPWFLGTIEWG
jgi:hypothetical protein